MTMPLARALPRKYMSSLEEAQEHLGLIAQRARVALSEVEHGRPPYQQTLVILRDIEASAYRVALELFQLEIASACDECPSAPPTTSAQIHLLVLAEEMERQAQLARQHALSSSGVPLAWSLTDGERGCNGKHNSHP